MKLTGEHELTLEWESSSSSDMIADSTLALIAGIDKSPASVKRACFIFFCLEVSICVDLYNGSTTSKNKNLQMLLGHLYLLRYNLNQSSNLTTARS